MQGMVISIFRMIFLWFASAFLCTIVLKSERCICLHKTCIPLLLVFLTKFWVIIFRMIKIVLVGKVPTCFYLNRVSIFLDIWIHRCACFGTFHGVYRSRLWNYRNFDLCVGLMQLLWSTIITKHVLLLQWHTFHMYACYLV
jgi:hypothetical protein